MFSDLSSDEDAQKENKYLDQISECEYDMSEIMGEKKEKKKKKKKQN